MVIPVVHDEGSSPRWMKMGEWVPGTQVAEFWWRGLAVLLVAYLALAAGTENGAWFPQLWLTPTNQPALSYFCVGMFRLVVASPSPGLSLPLRASP